MAEKKLETELNLSENSLVTLSRRYLKKDDKGKVIERPEDMFMRVAENIAAIDKNYGKSEEEIKKITKQFYSAMATLEFLPNSPTLMNAGRELQQLSACFVLPVEDSIESIFNSARDGAIVHKSGGGTGYSFSRLRPKGDIVKSTKGIASGPVSFIYPFNIDTQVVKQGGTRRGANMGILRVDHPDIEEFISAKAELNEENQAIMNKIKEKTGIYEEHPYYEAIKKSLIESSQLQNFNISVGLTKEFMDAVKTGTEYSLINPHNKKIVKKKSAIEIFDKICYYAWKNGEPGMIFLDKINDANPTPQLGEIESTNPCIVGSSLIPTENGLMRMNEISEKYPSGGISILTDNRTMTNSSLLMLGTQLRNISATWKRGVKETFKLITKAGFELIATADHKILTTNGWKELKDLTIEDKVMVQSGCGYFSQNKFISFETKYATKWTKELGQILGWLIGDGWLREGKNCRVGFVFSEGDKQILDCLKESLNKIYGKDIQEIKRKNGVFHLSYHSKEFVELFKKFGVKAVKSGSKIVPEMIFNSPKDSVVGFLQGLFTADGTIATNNKKNTNYIRLTSKSEKLLKGVQLLLLNLGIISRIYERHREKRLTFRYKTVRGEVRLYESDGILYELQISKDAIPKFLEEIGFLHNKHADKIKHLKKINFYRSSFEDRIVAIEPNGLEEVYDLSEEVTHSFIANGIIVHNCGEQPLLPYESCNLGSINLSKFIKQEDTKTEIDFKGLEKVVKTAVHFLDNVIDANNYPLKQIEKITKGNRKIGLGVMGFADMLVQLGIEYGSEESYKIAEDVMKFINEKATEASVELAKERGEFPSFKDSIYDKEGKNFKKDVKVRNATRTTIAPTGTISIIAEASSGIEPFFGLTYNKTVMDGTVLPYINPYLEDILKAEGIDSPELLDKIKKSGSSIQNITEIPEKIRKIFMTANDLSGEKHVKIESIFQRHTDNAVSKTINFPNSATVDDIRKAYLLAYEMGCKGITIYRDGSRDVQVIETTKQQAKKEKGKRAKELVGITRRERVGQGKTLYVTKNYEMDDELERISEIIKRKIPYETFVNSGFFDADLYGTVTSMAKMISKRLQKGDTIEEIAKDLENLPGNETGFDEGFESGKFYINRSLPDAIRNVLLDFKPKKKNGNSNSGNNNSNETDTEKKQDTNEKAGFCEECKTFSMFHKEGCYICTSCGFSEKCS